MYALKMIGAVVVAGAIAYASGAIADSAVHPAPLKENAVKIDMSILEEKPEPAAAPIKLAEAESAGTDGAVVEGADAPAAAMSLVEMIASADVERGKKLSRACVACHSFDKGGKNKVGPNQWDLIGREKGTVEGFKYSDVIKNLGGIWTYEELDAYLANPKKFAPGNKMTYAGMKKPEDRAALLAWLRQQSDNPQPLE